MNIIELQNLKKTELQAMCKIKGVKVSGTKEVLIQRLLGENNQSSIIVESKTKKIKTTKSKKKKTNYILTKMSSLRPIINVYKNEFNNFEHQPTKFIFDEFTHKVIGKQNDNGTIDKLTEQDLETCELYKFDYDV